LRDYVTLPDGLKILVGQVGMAKLVSECARSAREARRALDEYLKHGEAMLALDLSRLEELTAPPKVRWAAGSPLVSAQDWASTTDLDGRGVMANDVSQADKATQEAIKNQVYRIEQQIALTQQHAGEASPGSIGQDLQKDDVAKMRDLVQWLRRGSPYGDQSKNNTYYGLPEGTPGGVKTASEELVADAALSRLESAATKIDLLVQAGKKFDHVRAKSDLYRVASSVQKLLKGADVGATEAQSQLTALAEEAKRLHGLFANAKV
jgi:hypothetical protein